MSGKSFSVSYYFSQAAKSVSRLIYLFPNNLLDYNNVIPNKGMILSLSI